MLFLAALLSIAVGVLLGLLGGGGGMLTVPMLVYVLGVEPKSAILSSLFVVSVSSLASVASHAKRGRVRTKLALLFAFPGMAGSLCGSEVGKHLPAALLLAGFSLLMVVTALRMIRGGGVSAGPKEPKIATALFFGFLVGLVSGLVGAGGGFLLVPALTLLAGLSMHDAVGTSLLVIALQAMAGFLWQVRHMPVDWPLVLVVSAFSIVGSFVGVHYSPRISGPTLRRGFGYFVLAMGLLFLYREGAKLLRGHA